VHGPCAGRVGEFLKSLKGALEKKKKNIGTYIFVDINATHLNSKGGVEMFQSVSKNRTQKVFDSCFDQPGVHGPSVGLVVF